MATPRNDGLQEFFSNLLRRETPAVFYQFILRKGFRLRAQESGGAAITT
ncbi:MAG: hypothetical protein KGM47_07970 [Acidobacteriota bacterium]|nr:hypothetical protein [Acidobacteriota bacterium]